jgi:AraC-like DNA-binding protein
MPILNDATTKHYRDRDDLNSALTNGDLAFDVLSKAPVDVNIGIRHLEWVRVLNVSGAPTQVARGSRQISRDSGAFLGVQFQRAGYTLCRQHGQEQLIRPGEITLWHGRQPLDFRMPEPFQKLCLLVAIEQFEALLPDAELRVGAHFKAGTNFARLLSSCLITLSDEVLTSDEEAVDSAVEITLELLGAALTKTKESLHEGPRTNLFERIRAFIDKRLDDSDLSAATIARKHGISVRYLHLLFSEHGVTVGRWIRSRRLAQCRAELGDLRRDRSITEIAMKWGFSDAAHFSRLFKLAFGITPGAFRRTKTSSYRGAAFKA